MNNRLNKTPKFATTSYVYAGSRLISTETGLGTTYVTRGSSWEYASNDRRQRECHVAEGLYGIW
ncbi:MAG: hypothetical protein R2682_14695 [Pyrinomonadaceae bacterium]